MRILLAIVAVALLSVLGAVALGRASWDRAVAALDASLRDGVLDRIALPADALPPPVARYLDAALPDDGLAIRSARLTQEGTFRMADGPDGWRPFTAVERFRVVEPGFYWDARIEMAPLVTVRVLDRYEPGTAGMRATVLGLIPVMDLSDLPPLVEGALARYLAEAAWLPTRLAVGPGLAWSAVDDHHADATLTVGDTRVTLRFGFDERDDLVSVSGLRPREIDGDFVDTPWVGRFAEHRDVGGFRIPTYGEVAWVVDGEERGYWRGTVTSAEYR